MINKEILQYIEQDYVIVTPTQGLAHHLFSEYAAQQIEQNIQAWPSVEIVSWNIWLQQFWHEQSFYLDNPPLLLTKHQSLLLWCKVIESSKYAKQILQIEATARQVQAAYRLCKDWNIEKIPDNYFINQDSFAFKVWMESYELRCSAGNWLDEANLITYLEEKFSQSKNKKNKLVFFDFDNLTPKQNNFLEYLKKQSIDVEYVKPVNQNKGLEKVVCSNEINEIDAIANWIIECYQKKPNAKIGVIFPNLNAKKTLIKNELAKQLSIKQYLYECSQNKLPFTVSLGKPLKEYPMVSSALTILSLNSYKIDLTKFSLLLRSIHINQYKSEVNQRHLLDAELKKLGQPFINFKTILNIHERLDEENQCPIIINALEKYFSKKEEDSVSKSLRQWPSMFTEYLKLFLWPGDENLNSEAYQVWEAWQSCLEQLMTLTIFSNKYDFRSAFSLLNNLCSQIQFQPKTEEKNIFVMGIEGASGMQFDFSWFANLNDTVWPENPLTNPFLPLELQRDLEMPGSSNIINLNQAKKLTQSLLQSSKQVVFSYYTNQDDSELRPSPILKNINAEKTNITLRTSLAEKQFQKKIIQYIENDFAPKISSSQPINGTTSLFKDQAACPFKAFAKHRLYAESLNSAEIGLNAIDRGIIIHRVLQLFWEKIKHSDQLRRLSESVLEQRIIEVVKIAINEQKQFLFNTLKGRFIEIEQQRLCKILKKWIEIEKQREAFTVNAVEKGHHILFEGITLHMRIDRIDQLEDGRILIIDYKTGEISQNAWFGERPEDPQLPIYAITTDGEVAGLAFAKLKVGDYRFIGISDTEDLIPNIKALPPQQWEQCLKDWQSNLSSLAIEFRDGDAIVDPLPRACSFCDLPTLCRKSERFDIYLEEDE